MFKVIQLQKPGSEQVVAREVEGPVSLISSDGLSEALWFIKVEVREVNEVEEMMPGGGDDLNGVRIEDGERGAKRFVSGDDEIEGRMKCGEVEMTGDAKSGRDDVSGAVGFELI